MGFPFPKVTRTRPDLYANPKNVFHLVIHAMPGTSPFADRVGQRVWELVLGERERGAVTLLAACLMPTHLHALVKPAGRTIGGWVRAFKSYSTREAWGTGARTKMWQPGFYDHQIRDEREYEAVIQYVRENPQRAGLVAHFEEWDWMFVRRDDWLRMPLQAARWPPATEPRPNDGSRDDPGVVSPRR